MQEEQSNEIMTAVVQGDEKTKQCNRGGEKVGQWWMMCQLLWDGGRWEGRCCVMKEKKHVE